MRQWIIQTESILAGDWACEEEELTSQAVAERFDAWLVQLSARLQDSDALLEGEKECLAHFLKLSQSLRPRLFACYDVRGLPRTNNEMEGFIRSLKTRYRRVSGRKNWNAYLLRYGQSIAYFDVFEQAGYDEHKLFSCLAQVDHLAWRQTRKAHRQMHEGRVKLFRFCHHQEQYLQALEARWEHTLGKT